MKRFTLSLILITTLLSCWQTVDGQQAGRITLFRFGNPGNEKPGVITTGGRKLDVSGFGEDYNSTFFSSDGIARLEKWLMENEKSCPEVSADKRIASSVANPSKIVGIGLNYALHAGEAGVPIPKEPVIFLKSTTSISGPNDEVIIPLYSKKTDWEAELAIVIGKTASNISEDDAMNYIAGFTIINDYSERANQLEGTGQWTKGKSADTFGPIGPLMLTHESIGDPQNLKITLKINGETMQESNTSDMVFGVKHLVSYISRFMTLLPGDIIATGTPAGVGLGHKPQRFLKHGDVIELDIEKLGKQKQTAVDAMQKILGAEAYKDYQAWVALGLGGIPHTLEGYRRVKMLGTHMGNPLDTKLIRADIGTRGDIKTVGKLPRREGKKPVIAPFAVPHRQMDQHNDTLIRKAQTKIFDEQVADARYPLMYKMSFFEKHSPAVFLKDSAAGNPTLIPLTHGEIGHIHPSDGSMHMILSPSDTKIVMENGWGELHGLAGQGGEMAKTYLMIYAPRNEHELKITKEILEAAVRYAAFVPK